MGNKCCENCGFVSSYGRPNYHSFDCSEDSTNTPTVDSSVEWEIQFDSIVNANWKEPEFGHEWRNSMIDYTKKIVLLLKDFTRTTLQSNHQSLITRIKGEVEKKKDIGETCIENDDWKKGHRFALTDLLNRIDEIV